MSKSDGQQLNFNFENNIKELIPENITLDELLYVLNNYSDSELAQRYYFDRISRERGKK